MALKAIRCPQCGSDVELDDGKEFGFCSSCGTKIMLHEVMDVKHSGTVQYQVDNSAQGRNRIALGSRAFESKNWAEAYEYFTKGLEDVPNDFTALYRKGIAAIYMSSLDNLRIPELVTGRSNADREWMNCREGLDPEKEENRAALENLEALANQMEVDFCRMLDAVQSCQEFNSQQANIDGCRNQAARWCELVKLYQASIPAMWDEQTRERVLNNAIQLCDRILSFEVKYYTHTTTNKKGKRTDHFSVYKMDDGRTQLIQNVRKDLAEQYNELPSRKARANELDDQANELNQDLKKLQEQADQLRVSWDEATNRLQAAKAEFWEKNPELEIRKKKGQNLSWISVGVGAVVFLIGLLLRGNGMVYPVGGAAAFVVSFVVKNFLGKSFLAKLEAEVFPETLTALVAEVSSIGEEWSSATKKVAEKQSEISTKQGEIAAFAASRK